MITAVIDAIEAMWAERSKIYQDLVPEVTFARGALTIAMEGAPPKITWVYGGGSIAGPSTALIGTMAIRRHSMGVHVWGKDTMQAEFLLSQLMGVGDQLTPARFEIVNEDWTITEGANADFGHVILATAIIKAPVMRLPDFEAIPNRAAVKASTK